ACSDWTGKRLKSRLQFSPGLAPGLFLCRTKFGGMAVPAAQLDLGRPFQEKLSCPFDERREIFVCEDGVLVPEQISFYFHFRELVVGVDGVAESLTSSNPIRGEIRLPPPCEGRHARSYAPPSIGPPPYRRARRVSRFPHWTSSSILLGVTACASTQFIQHVGPPFFARGLLRVRP